MKTPLPRARFVAASPLQPAAERGSVLPWLTSWRGLGQRFEEPPQVAQAVAFITSPAGDYITGTALSIDGSKQLTRHGPTKE
jgi:NAD(P)-dependent dehydrogenase (short-subunit alcohol dehydrogenase family)